MSLASLRLTGAFTLSPPLANSAHQVPENLHNHAGKRRLLAWRLNCMQEVQGRQ